jgi:DNA-binding CsgD family transcriptional regulator
MHNSIHGLNNFLCVKEARSYPALGFSFFLAWIQISFLSKLLVSGTGNDFLLLFYCHLVSVAVLAIALFASIRVLHLRFKSKTIGNYLMIASVLLMAVSVLLQALPDLKSTGGVVFLVLSGSLSGLGSSFFFIAWATHFESAGQKKTLIEVAWGFFYAAVLYALISFLPFFARVFFATLLPVGSALLLRLTERRVDNFQWESENKASAKALTDKPLPISKALAVKVFCANAVFGLLSGFLRSLVFSDTAADATSLLLPITISGVAVCLLVLIGNAWSKRFDYVALYRVSIPIIICGLLLALLLQSIETAASTLIMLGIACINIMLWGFLSHIADKRQLAAVFGLGLSGLYAGNFFGSVSAFLLDLAFNRPTVLLGGAAVSILLLVSVYIYVLPEKELGLSDRVENKPGKWRQRIILLAEEHGLTQREQEVFILLAQGQSAKKIQDPLFISASTVNAHRYHIYDKLGVATKQELINYVENSTIKNTNTN